MENLDEFLSKGKEWFDRLIENIREYAKKLEESEKWFSTTLSSIGDAVIATDKLGKVQFLNPVAESLTGWKLEESVEKPLLDIFKIVNEKTRKSVENPVSRVIREGVIVGLANHTVLITKSGKEIPIADSGAPIKDDKGNIIGIVLIFRDITEQKKAEQALKESEERYRNLFEVSIEGIGVIKGIRFVTANKALLDIFEYDTVEEIQEIPIFEHVAPESREEAIEQFKKRERGEVRESRLELKIIRKDGELRDVELSSIDVFFGNEKYLQTTVRDITERKKAEKALKESKQLHEKTLYSLHDAVFIIDAKTVEILDCNPAASEIFGYSREDMIGQTTTFLHVNEEHLEEFRRNLNPAIEKYGFIKNFEFKMKRKDDTIFNTEHSVSPLLDEKNHRFGWVSVVRDITERKLAEQKLKESEKGYRVAYNRAEFYKDLFTHDINNILQGVLSGVELSEMHIRDSEKPEKLKEVNSMIKDQVTRGARLVSNISKLSKLEETEISIKQIEICSILAKSITFVKNSYHNITIQIDSISKKLYIQANELLEDVFENLLINAVKYNENPIAEIIVKISKEKRESINYLKMEFLDNGIGINDLRKKLIFQREYNEERSVHGMGLGLSLVKKIIETYNGKIWVEDRVKGDHSKGSNFVLLIPEV